MEIQLVQKVRNLGIGRRLMNIGEQWSKKYKMERLMLTVFLSKIYFILFIIYYYNIIYIFIYLFI